MRLIVGAFVFKCAFFFASVAGGEPSIFEQNFQSVLRKVELRLSQSRVVRGDIVEAVVLLFDETNSLINTPYRGELFVQGEKLSFETQGGLAVLEVPTESIFVDRPSLFVKVAALTSTRQDFFISEVSDGEIEFKSVSDWRLYDYTFNRAKLSLIEPEIIEDGVEVKLYGVDERNFFSLFNLKKFDQSLFFDLITYALPETLDLTIFYQDKNVQLPKMPIRISKIVEINPNPILKKFGTHSEVEFSNLAYPDGGYVADGISGDLIVQHGRDLLFFESQTVNGRIVFDFLPNIFENTDVLLKFDDVSFRFSLGSNK